MKMNFTKAEYIHTNEFVKWLMIFVRALFTLSISSLILSSILMLLGGFYKSIPSGIMWFSIMGSILIYYFSILTLVGVAVYYKVKKEKVWKTIKKEVILLGVSIFCFLVLGLINNYVIN